MKHNIIGGLSETNIHHLKILMALRHTLVHFDIPPTQQRIIGEALLRFRILKDMDLEYNTRDRIMCRLLMMDQYFGRQLSGL